MGRFFYQKGKHLIKWNVIKIPRGGGGGLSIPDLQERNFSLGQMDMALLCIKSDLWRKVIAVKYGTNHFNHKPGIRNLHASYGPWKYIDASKDMLYNHIKQVVGNARSTSFWKDHWLGGMNIQESFHGLPIVYQGRCYY